MRLSGRLVKFDFLNPPPIQQDEPEQLIAFDRKSARAVPASYGVVGQQRVRDIFAAVDTLPLCSTFGMCAHDSERRTGN